MSAVASINKARKFTIAGAVCYLVGFVLVWIFPVGTLFGILFLLLGHRANTILRCGNCGNRLPDKHVKICASCQKRLW